MAKEGEVTHSSSWWESTEETGDDRTLPPAGLSTVKLVEGTYVLALKRVEEVSTQLPIIPRGPGGIADAT